MNKHDISECIFCKVLLYRQVTLFKVMRQHREMNSGAPWSLSDCMWDWNISISALAALCGQAPPGRHCGLVGVRTGSLCCAACCRALAGNKTYGLMFPQVCTQTRWMHAGHNASSLCSRVPHDPSLSPSVLIDLANTCRQLI